jgi:hypothetical protein
MPPLTEELLRSVLLGRQRHPNYNRCVELANALTVHADGLYPGALIDERRPSESPEIKEYRKKIYKPITRRPLSKIITSLGKIRRSPDWSVQYTPGSTPAVVPESETLEEYCEKKYPVHASVTSWMFSEVLRRYALDANAVVAVIPKSVEVAATEFLQPVGMIFESKQVLDYLPGEYAMLQSSETVPYFSPQGRVRYEDGAVCYVVTPTYVERREQTSRAQDFIVRWRYEHGFGELPAFKVGGQFLASKSNDIIYQSRIADIVPSLDEAAREYSDLQAEIVQHIHSEKYVYTNTECPDCRGVGTVKREGENKTCPHCNGLGSVRSVTPYGTHIITLAKAGEATMPTPPIGYIQKQTEIARLQDERIRQHIYDALSAVNMEFLAETPLNQSGTAKEVDKDELNNLVGAIAEDLVAIMDKVYRLIAEYRYATLVPNAEKRRAMLPAIPVPERFDLLNTSHIMTELTAAKTAGVNPVLVRNLEVDYSAKKFNANPEVSDFLRTVYALDPLPGITEDEKMVRLSNGGITEQSYIISCNIIAFVQRAAHEDKEFSRKPLPEQQKVVERYAEEVLQANSAKEQAMQMLAQPAAAPNNPNQEQQPADVE